jgi:hypothetical protein
VTDAYAPSPDDEGDRLPVSTVAVEPVADDHPASLTVAGAVPDSRPVAPTGFPFHPRCDHRNAGTS